MRILPILLKVVMLTPVLFTGFSFTAQANPTDENSSQPNSGKGLFAPMVIDFEDFAAETFIFGDEWLAKYGVEISLDSRKSLKGIPGKQDLPLRLYNSNCRPEDIDKDEPGFEDTQEVCTGGDGDLATGEYFGSPAQGNVLIIQEDNSTSKARRKAQKEDPDSLEYLGDPDDDKGGGTITFHFDQLIRYISVGFLDFDERGKKANRATFRFDIKEDPNDTPLEFKIKDVEAVDPDYKGDNSLRLFENVLDEEPVPFNRLRIQIPGSGAITHLCFSPEVAPGGSHNWADDAESCRW